MYYRLQKNGITLEYINECITISYDTMQTRIYNHAINNLSTIIHRLYPGVVIEDLVIDSLIIHYDIEETLYINNELMIPTNLVETLITLIDQSEGLRLNLVIPKKEK